MFTRQTPLSVTYDFGKEVHRHEGRVITAEYPEFYLVCCYTPNSKDQLARLDYRMEWEDDIRDYLMELDQTKPVVYCGDLNVAHQEIDLKNPKSNRRNAGFTDEERADPAMEKPIRKADKAAASSKAAKEAKSKETKEEREKREKYEKLMKKAEELTAARNHREAVSVLTQAKAHANAAQLKEIEEKIKAADTEMNRGSLFDLMEQEAQPEPSVQQQQPHSQQPVYTQTPVQRNPQPQRPQQPVPQRPQQA